MQRNLLPAFWRAPSTNTIPPRAAGCARHRAKQVSSNKIMDFFARCPDNAFQRVQPGMEPFSLGQRFGAIARNGSKLLGVGFCASMLGG